MAENEVFLKYLIDEEIYIIKDKTSVDPGVDHGVIDDKDIKGSPGQESKLLPDVHIKTKFAAGTERIGDAYKTGDIDDTSDAGRSVAKNDTSDADASVAKKDSSDESRLGAEEETTVVSSASTEGNTTAAGSTLAKDGIAGLSSVSTKNDKSDTGSSLDIEDNSEVISAGEHKESKRYKAATVLLLDYDDRASITAENRDLLAKILQSVNLDLDSVEIVFRNEFDKLKVTSFIDCPVIAFLQLMPQHISALFASEKYMINIINGNQFVACDTLNDLNQNRSLKRKLWEQLKLIYGI